MDFKRRRLINFATAEIRRYKFKFYTSTEIFKNISQLVEEHDLQTMKTSLKV